ncbi:hypothetical protein [Microcoleus vaginatus]|uniref:hypothetical protein n=1 Tax=Microcoleus vaginatus TaxID=119532 RepID=UPI0008FBC882
MVRVSIEQVWPAPQCQTAGKINNIAEGSSATDSVTDVTDVTDVRKKEEGRRKKENASFPGRLKSLIVKLLSAYGD